MPIGSQYITEKAHQKLIKQTKKTPFNQKIIKLAILPYSLHVHNHVQIFLKPQVQIYYHKYPYQCHVHKCAQRG